MIRRSKILKKGNEKVDAVIETFGGLEVATVIVFCAALFAIWKLYRKAKKYIIEQYQREDDVDYEKIYKGRYKLLRKAYERSDISKNPDFVRFQQGRRIGLAIMHFLWR